MKKLLIVLMLISLCACEEVDEPTSDNQTDNSSEVGDGVILPECFEEGEAMTIRFEMLPQSKEDIEEMADFTNPKLTTALFILSLRHYVEDPDEAIEMINVLLGPEDLSDYDKSFIKDRLSDKPYLMDSYFNGSSVSNDYTPLEPFEITLYDDQLEPIEGYLRIFVRSSGADSLRYLQLRQKGDEYFIWDYPGIVVSIRLPASQDPWAD